MSHRSSRSYYDSSSADSHQAGGHDGRHRHRERSRSPQTHRRAARSNYSPEQGSHYGSSSSSNSNNHHHHHNNSSNHHRDNPRYSRYHDNDDYRPDSRRRYDDRSLHYDDPRHHHSRHPPPPHHQRIEDQGPAKPNINVVLRSLPDKATEQDIHKTLEDMEGSVDEVTLIRDRDTGESRKFAFVRFTSVGHAVQFVEKHYPHFYMGHHRVRIDYCQKDGSRTSKSEWRCPTCGKFNDESRRTCVECRSMVHEGTRAQKRSKETESMAINDGTSDVSQMASNMLLLQNLDHLSSEESIFNAVKEYQGIQRVLLIKDKLTRMSCEFAFVDFVNVQCAVTAMRQMNSQGFKVDGRAPKVSFGSPDSFLPAYAASEWTVQADVADGLWMYHDEHAYASEYSLRLEQERAEKEEQEKRLAAERKMKQEETSKSKDPLEDDLSAFYAGMGSILSSDDKKESTEDIFSVPKV